MGMDFNDSHVLVLTNIRRNKNKYIVRKSKQNKISMMQNLAARVLAVDDPFQSFIYTEKMLLIFYASRLTFRYFPNTTNLIGLYWFYSVHYICLWGFITWIFGH
jgi:hypothetical protein